MNAATLPLLQIEDVTKTFTSGVRSICALQSVSFNVASGEFICLLGPSGSGKSTLLRIIGGLLAPDAGAIWFQGARLTAPHSDIGFVFQTTNLMPWRTVLQNVLLPLEVQQGKLAAADTQKATELLALVGLRGFEQAYPKHLSGGMRQRALIAMALACEFIEDRGDAARDWALIGSSLGGYYATWLAERYGCRAALLNPAVLPADDLAGYVGEHTMYHSSEPFEWRVEYLHELQALRVDQITRPERYLLLAATGDEVLDWHQMRDHYAGAQQHIIDGSDHAISEFADYVELVADFCAGIGL